MNILTRHPHDQGISYFEHLRFATGIAWNLFRSVLAFTLHGLLPFLTIKRELDLEATSAFLLERNRYIEAAALNSVAAGPDIGTGRRNMNTSAA